MYYFYAVSNVKLVCTKWEFFSSYLSFIKLLFEPTKCKGFGTLLVFLSSWGLQIKKHHSSCSENWKFSSHRLIKGAPILLHLSYFISYSYLMGMAILCHHNLFFDFNLIPLVIRRLCIQKIEQSTSGLPSLSKNNESWLTITLINQWLFCWQNI